MQKDWGIQEHYNKKEIGKNEKMIRAIIYVWLILFFYTPSCYAEDWNLLGYYDNEDIVVYNDRSETNWRKRYNTSQRGWIWDINTVIMEKKVQMECLSGNIKFHIEWVRCMVLVFLYRLKCQHIVDGMLRLKSGKMIRK